SPDLVHDVVAETLQQAHDRLGLTEELTLLVGHQALEPVLAAAVAAEGPADGPRRIAGERRGGAAEQRELALEAFGQVGAQPPLALELEGVRGLVEGDPGPERRNRHAKGVRRRADVLLDEEQAPLRGLG